jgi:hypothetical protein
MADWTPETLFIHFTQRFLDAERATRIALEASEKAVTIAEGNADKWRANANEWRAAMTDRERNFASSKKLDDMERRVDRWEGAAMGMKSAWVWLLGAIAALSTCVAIYSALRR